MTSISSINTSFYPELIEGFAPVSTRAIPALQAEQREEEARAQAALPDLSNYYSNIKQEDLLSQTGKNVTKSAEDLDNAMVSALEQGYSVNDACKIKNVEMAYKANAYMFKVASEISTFLLEV